MLLVLDELNDDELDDSDVAEVEDVDDDENDDAEEKSLDVDVLLSLLLELNDDADENVLLDDAEPLSDDVELLDVDSLENVLLLADSDVDDVDELEKLDADENDDTDDDDDVDDVLSPEADELDDPDDDDDDAEDSPLELLDDECDDSPLELLDDECELTSSSASVGAGAVPCPPTVQPDAGGVAPVSVLTYICGASTTSGTPGFSPMVHLLDVLFQAIQIESPTSP